VSTLVPLACFLLSVSLVTSFEILPAFANQEISLPNTNRYSVAVSDTLFRTWAHQTNSTQSEVTAYSDYERMGSVVLRNPLTCIFEPAGGFETGVLWQSLHGIRDWQYGLEKYTSNYKGWFIPIKVVTLEEQKKFNASICDVTIKYFDQNSVYDGYTYYSNPDDVKQISIYENDLTAPQIGVIVEHEFGHALGIGDYTERDASGRYFINLDSQYFDVMSLQPDFIYNKPFEISNNDLSVLIEKYGPYGFGGHLYNFDA
jgi:hypothetical protein